MADPEPSGRPRVKSGRCHTSSHARDRWVGKPVDANARLRKVRAGVIAAHEGRRA